MAKLWVFLQISILTACSVVGTATHVGAKTGLTALPQAEQEISPQLIGLPPLNTLLDDFVRNANRGARSYTDDLIQQSDEAVRTARNAKIRNQAAKKVMIGLRDLNYKIRPTNVKNARLNSILDDIYKSKYCKDFLLCGVMWERTLELALTNQSYIERAKDLETVLKNLREEGVLKDLSDISVAKNVYDDLNYALSFSSP
jgi:hypothetical protein